MMEVECLEAEARAFRTELWAAMEESERASSPRRLASRLASVGLVGVLATILVLSTGLSLSVDQDRPFQFHGGESVALLSTIESDMIDALRESLSSGNRGRVVVTLDIADEPGRPKAEPGSASAAEAKPLPVVRYSVKKEARGKERPFTKEPLSPKENEASNRRLDPSEEPSFDDVISLVQVGQRALRVFEPAVKVVK